jgi:hypothetical protein
MADETKPFYGPQEPEAPPEKRKPGRPPNPAKVAAAVAVDVTAGVSADASIAPDSTPQAGETLEQATERIRSLRGTRSPFGSLHQKLALPARPGYHRHWFNDVGGRIDEAKASGWAHVKNERDGSPLKRSVGTGRDSNVLYAYAMELPLVFWQEEMDARHDEAKSRVDAIKKKVAVAQPGQSQASDQGKFYSPVEGTDPIQVVKG